MVLVRGRSLERRKSVGAVHREKYTLFDVGSEPHLEKLADAFILEMILLHDGQNKAERTQIARAFRLPSEDVNYFFKRFSDKPTVAESWIGGLEFIEEDQKDLEHVWGSVISRNEFARNTNQDYVEATQDIAYSLAKAEAHRDPTILGLTTEGELDTSLRDWRRVVTAIEMWLLRREEVPVP